jgi:hypothetical protein
MPFSRPTVILLDVDGFAALASRDHQSDNVGSEDPTVPDPPVIHSLDELPVLIGKATWTLDFRRCWVHSGWITAILP